jgi:hypothetical protein
VLDFLDGGCFLQLGILQEKTIHEAAMNIDINVLVDSGGNEKAAVLPIIGWEISAAPAERDSHWRARDDHPGIPSVEKLSKLVQRI